MKVTGLGAYTQGPASAARPQQNAQAAEEAVAQGSLPVRPQPAPVNGKSKGMRALDALSSDERNYFESLFPGITDGAAAADSYANLGRGPSVKAGTLVDRRG